MAKPTTRCAVYTRKSSEEGLEQSFNSLHAQREACEAFILSQRHEGWSVIDTAYDDGGFSGGTMERPALKTLLADIRGGNVDVVVVYKIDRLTRSLFDFAKIVEIFDSHKVSFVSVTQSFNTTTSMGRLTLNVLLSFAQFEREVTGERIRDKIAASKKRGMWMGGNIPLGYDLKDRKLVINKAEAATVTTIFTLYASLGTVRKVKAELDQRNLRTKIQTRDGIITGGLPFRVGHIYTILRNVLYRGQIAHKGALYDGDHPAIIDEDLWGRVQGQLASNAIARRSGATAKNPSPLAGLLFDEEGNAMTPSHANKHGKRYRYYISRHLTCGMSDKRGSASGDGLRLAANEIERQVVQAIATLLVDTQRLFDELDCKNLSPENAKRIIDTARKAAEEVRSRNSPAGYQTLRQIVSRIGIAGDAIIITIDRIALADCLGISVGEAQVKDGPFQIRVAAELQRLGKEKRLVIAAHSDEARPDPALIKAVVRAHDWFEMLRSGKASSPTSIAALANVPRSYVGQILPLAFLAPDITDAILDGRQPVDLTLGRLMKAMPLPPIWETQRSVLGFRAV